ncbi:MAG: hypothetical protein ACRCTS_01685 [Fusobacteriaceae bacterium]
MFKVNDRVIDDKRGLGVVVRILSGYKYQVGVRLDCGAVYSYTMEGKAFESDDEISLRKGDDLDESKIWE